MSGQADDEPVAWHLPEPEVRGYAAGVLAPPLLWSVEAHLAACPACLDRLAAAADPDRIAAGWARLDAELDAPAAGPIERLIRWCGVGDHTARLLAATPVLRLSWLASVVLTLALTVVVASTVNPWVLLAVAPLLPLVGVAASFGPRVDPTYELSVVAPMHTFRLLLLRCAAVLTTTTLLSLAATLAVPRFGLTALGWFLPALSLTLLTLALTPRFGPVPAATAVGLGWITVVAAATASVGSAAIASTVTQSTAVVVAALAAAALVRLRPAFDSPRRFHQSPQFGIRRSS